jgi:hypothetical protein
MLTQREKIIKKTIEIWGNHSNGLRYSESVREIKNQLSELIVVLLKSCFKALLIFESAQLSVLILFSLDVKVNKA